MKPDTWFIIVILGGASLFVAGALLGAGIQWDSDKKKIDNLNALSATSDFDRGSNWGMHYCARDPLYWECLTKEQQEEAKAYAKQHARP